MNRSSRLQKLKCLVDELSDRDRQLKQDSSLFEDFFDNFPIPVTMWSLDNKGKIISKRGNKVVKEDGTCVEDMFLEEYSEDFETAHEEAYSGKNVAFFSSLPGRTYYTRLVPRRDDSDQIIGLTGISWDITSNYEILEILSEICKLSNLKSKNGKKIKELATKAVSISRISGLLEKKSGKQ